MASYLGSLANRVLRYFGYVPAGEDTASHHDADLRRDGYRARELWYTNQIYRANRHGGLLEQILRDELGRDPETCTSTRLSGVFNPVPDIVDAYQNVLRGRWGEELEVAEKAPNGREVNPRLIEGAADGPLARLWQWSNLDTEKAKLCEWAANLGTVGVRVVAVDDPDATRRRVSLQLDHPRRIEDFEEDARGNLTAVLLKYTLYRGELGDTQRDEVEVEEVIGRDGFSLKYDGTEQLTAEQRQNRLGFCPYVMVRHKDRGAPWGDWAYVGCESKVHEINWLISRQSKSVDRHVFPTWFGTYGGTALPDTFPIGEETVALARTVPGAPVPSFAPLVANLDQAGAMNFWLALRDLVRQGQPELNINDVKLLSGVSGETLAQVLKPAEARILQARAGYEHALVRALQMGLSAGSVLGTWDVGRGTGSAEAADRAYRTGLLDFAFKARPALPPTSFEREREAKLEEAPKQAKLATAKMAEGLVDEAERLRLAGYDEQQVAEIARRRAAEVRREAQAAGAAGGNGRA